MKLARASDLMAVHDIVAHQLERPFGDASHSVMAMDDLAECKRGDDGDLVIGEIVLQLRSCHEQGV
jgi:hypothetical protein